MVPRSYTWTGTEDEREDTREDREDEEEEEEAEEESYSRFERGGAALLRDADDDADDDEDKDEEEDYQESGDDEGDDDDEAEEEEETYDDGYAARNHHHQHQHRRHGLRGGGADPLDYYRQMSSSPAPSSTAGSLVQSHSCIPSFARLKRRGAALKCGTYTCSAQSYICIFVVRGLDTRVER